MILSWLVYALVVSAGVSVAAWLAERALQSQGWPTRPAWALAMVASVAVPVAAWLRPGATEPTALASVPGAYVLGSLPRVTAPAPSGPSLETLLLGGWVLATTLLLTAVVVLAARLWLRFRRWPSRWVDGVEVRVSRRTGPAALGMVRGRVVVPEWTLGLEPRQRELLVLHESEHVRARDPQLALFGLLACVLAPWNLPLWWQLRRLRLAIEVDCDARVLRRAEDAHGYGSLLLAVGQRRARLALALAEPKSMLERRIRMITKKRNGRAWLQAVALMALAGVALAVACETPSPTDSRETAGALKPGGADDAASATDDPIGLIKERVAGQEHGGLQCAKFVIDGQPADYETARELVPEVIERIEVVKGAAAGEDAPCGKIYISTQEGDAERPERARQFEAQEAPGGTADAEPTFTPMTRAPQLKRTDHVAQLLQERYPPLLRDAGIGGTANVWFFIDEAGLVQKAQINKSSGSDALDQAALDVARDMEFEPALNRDERVPVWVALDITFEVK